MYNIIICDDDNIFIQYMEKIILNSGVDIKEVNFYKYLSGEELLENLDRSTAYDLLLLDMQLKALGGNETAKQFRKNFPDTILAFCSGVCQPTAESFETTPFRYLLKEYTDSRMLQEMRVIIQRVKDKKEEPFIFGSYHGNFIKLKPDDILYVAIAKHGSHIYVHPDLFKYDSRQNIGSRKKVGEIFNILKNFGFVYAHHSYIVNLKYIKGKTLKELELIDGTLLSISRSKEKELRIALAEYLGKKY